MSTEPRRPPAPPGSPSLNSMPPITQVQRTFPFPCPRHRTSIPPTTPLSFLIGAPSPGDPEFHSPFLEASVWSEKRSLPHVGVQPTFPTP